jgi:hypothetical protein
MSEDTNRKIKSYERPSEYIPRFIAEKYDNNEKEFLKVLETHKFKCILIYAPEQF